MMDHRFLSDKEIISRCRKGERRAWEELVRRYQGLIYSVGVRSGLGEEASADLFQNVCLILVKKLGTLKKEATITAWIVTTTKREAWRLSKQFASRKEERTEGSLTDLPTEKPLQDEELMRLEKARMVREGSVGLDSKCGKTISSLFLENREISYKKLAKELKVPVSSIGPMRMRCLERLRKILKKQGFFRKVYF